MDDQPLAGGEEDCGSSACWAMPGAMLLVALVLIAFLSQFAPPQATATPGRIETAGSR